MRLPHNKQKKEVKKRQSSYRMQAFLIGRIKNKNKGKMCFNSRSQNMKECKTIN